MSKMSVEEATYYWFLGLHGGDSLCESYPELETEKARRKAWNDDNLALAKEAMTVYMTTYPEQLCSNLARHQRRAFWLLLQLQHKEPRQQTRARPSYIAAKAYLLANYDSRVPWAPYVMTVPAGWHPGVWYLEMHPEEWADLHSGAVHDPVRFPLLSEVTAAAHAAGRYETTRYTVFGWRKLEEERTYNWQASQRYVMEYFDLKEVLDAEGRVVSSEWAADYQIETERPRL
ncbi:hypothetical protein B0H16DRAFT_1721429 [Mycena metata]|uniref:Uncharacterized protein n=1 Tax=Mycena metata TaxID=1033252 RepID=A0AAD7J548_9AGAR|nr:hypothetical protein B0H16DRAFT_1721429 [Mycena metata]